MFLVNHKMEKKEMQCMNEIRCNPWFNETVVNYHRNIPSDKQRFEGNVIFQLTAPRSSSGECFHVYQCTVSSVFLL